MKTIIIWTAAFVTLATLAFAAVPQTINYQGYLKDKDVPVSAPTGMPMTFSLYSSATPRNNPVWRENQPKVPVTNGVYSTQLGSVLPINAPFDVPYWLGVQVNNGIEMTLQPLSSSPYALRAATADSMNAGTQTLLTGGAANTGLVVQGAAGQTANLQEWQNSSTVPVASISPGGDLTLTGNLMLPTTSATAGQIRQGGATLLHTFGHNNFFTGSNAGNLTMSGSLNTAVGFYSLPANTTGSLNAANGVYALFFNSTGDNNTANGAAALYSNTIGAANTASGAYALYSNTTGLNNTANGTKALYLNTVGYYNTASGLQALYSNSDGSGNSANGMKALYSNTTGDNNTANGIYSLFNNLTGSGNSANGMQSLYSNSTGSLNTANGESALYSNTIGNNNTANGAAALYLNTTGINNTAIGNDSGSIITTGSNNTFLGKGSNASANNISNATAIGYIAAVDASNHVRIGNTSITQIGGQVGWTSLSDIRSKKDVADVPNGLDFIKQLRPVEYRMKEGNGKKDFGFIAQEVEALLGTEYNVLGIGGDAERTLSLRYTDFIAPLVKAVQEQQATIDRLNADNAGMKARLERLEALLQAK